jgi:hypothetical protein
MLYSVGVILQKERMPDTSAIQAWFDANQLPVTIDDVPFSAPSTVISGSVLGQRVFADLEIDAYQDGKGQFCLVFDEYFQDGDCVVSVLGSASLTQRSFAFLAAASMAMLSDGKLVSEDQPRPDDPSETIKMCREAIVYARLLITMLYRQAEFKYVRLDAESIRLMDGESQSDRKSVISGLCCSRYIQPDPRNVPGLEHAAYKLTDSGLEIASSMYWYDVSERSRKHRELITGKDC